MPPERPDPSNDEMMPGAGSSATWVWWTVVLAVLGAIGLLGGWLIGLAPVYTVGLLIVLAVTSGAWLLIARRRFAAPTPVGVVGRMAVTGVVVLLAIQALPMGRDHTNPAISGEPAWSSPRTRELMVAACYSCHSNEVEWPWYSNVAPMSWAVSDHVDEGRDAVNFSEFATDPGDADESIEEILDGSMPPAYFTRFGLHPEANLSPSERSELIAGLRATPGFGEGEHDDEHDD